VPHETILYAEDDATVRRAVTELLEEAGLRVDACADGDSALNKLAGATHYDLLLFDSELPCASGVELTRRARGLARYSETPIIMLSAGRYDDEARAAGADLFLRKPEDVGRLIDVILSLLDGRGAWGESRRA
jgi:CheY-like chemotaxis protein